MHLMPLARLVGGYSGGTFDPAITIETIGVDMDWSRYFLEVLARTITQLDTTQALFDDNALVWC